MSDYTETSSHDDVLGFLRVVWGSDPSTMVDGEWSKEPGMRATTFGQTVEGRTLPLVLWGKPAATASAQTSGMTRVLLFANIHAGEVAGKEALLMMLRDLARGRHDAWADSLVLLVAPIYNADGNERVAYDNRPLQLGPVGGMGQRANAEGLDLNRDFMKLASPEARALVQLIDVYDPHVIVDLHTTNGTRHGYHLTYAPPLHPNTPDGIEVELWEGLLPAVTEAVERKYGWAFWHYGNVPGAFGEPEAAPRAWYSFSPQPRFGTNYAGLRNRFGILSEAYSYATFEERVVASKQFVEEVVDYVADHAGRIRTLAEEADAASIVGDTLALRATWDALPEPVEILLGEADTVYHPVTNAPMLQRRDVRRPETMPAFVRFAPTEVERVPEAYYLPVSTPGAADVRALLHAHGIRHETAMVWGFDREAFHIDSVRVAEQAFQERRAVEVFGEWVPVEAETEEPPRLAAAIRVPLDQPLGRLAFALLEPRSDDGVAAWALFPENTLRSGTLYPILRVPAGR